MYCLRQLQPKNEDYNRWHHELEKREVIDVLVDVPGRPQACYEYTLSVICDEGAAGNFKTLAKRQLLLLNEEHMPPDRTEMTWKEKS